VALAFSLSLASLTTVTDAAEELYAASVPATSLSGPGLEEAYGRALQAVLVRVTGRRAGIDAAALGPAGALVRQYQPLPGGQLKVGFDPPGVRRRLDARNLPVWGSDRPATLVRLLDSVPAGAVSPAEILVATATERGIEIQVADGGETRAEGGASVLTGRPQPASGAATWGWVWSWRDLRAEWAGDLAAGVHGVADRLATRFATTAADKRVLEVEVESVDSFESYGRVMAYLQNLDLVHDVFLHQVRGTTLAVNLSVRGGPDALLDTLALREVLVPVESAGAMPGLRLRPAGFAPTP
jgi:hypothetical protein